MINKIILYLYKPCFIYPIQQTFSHSNSCLRVFLHVTTKGNVSIILILIMSWTTLRKQPTAYQTLPSWLLTEYRKGTLIEHFGALILLMIKLHKHALTHVLFIKVKQAIYRWVCAVKTWTCWIWLRTLPQASLKVREVWGKNTEQFLHEAH